MGKFSQRKEGSSLIYVRCQEELAKLFYSHEFSIEDVTPISEGTCQVLVQKKSKHDFARDTNCAITAFVTAYSRVEMHCDIQKLFNANMIPLYSDTDSILWAQKKSEKVILSRGAAFGQYKREIHGDIQSFYSLGKKKYCVTYTSSNGENGSMTKVCGLSFNNETVSQNVTPELFAAMLRDHLKKERKESLKLPQLRKFVRNHNIFHKNIHVGFGNFMKVQRTVNFKSKNLVTYPYGWKH